MRSTLNLTTYRTDNIGKIPPKVVVVFFNLNNRALYPVIYVAANSVCGLLDRTRSEEHLSKQSYNESMKTKQNKKQGNNNTNHMSEKHNYCTTFLANPAIATYDWTFVTKQPIMRIEDRLFDRGWVRSAMATRKCGNIYFRKYFMAVRKFTNIFVLLLILMVGSRDTLFLVCFI